MIPQRRHRTMIVGNGRAGGRFIRALGYGECAARFEVIALVDIDPARLPDKVGFGTYTSLSAALEREQPDVVIVTVNEDFHFEILETALAAPSVRHIVCEKPLTRTLEEFLELAPQTRGIPISVNFVERYSPIVEDCLTWLHDVSAAVARAEFWWGKYRIRDPRPTMGVLSELSHPLDLVRHIVGSPEKIPIQMSSAAITSSDFSSFSNRTNDGANLIGNLGECLVVGNSSFIWDERRRKIILYARNEITSRTWQLVLTFDDPVWDDDTFTVHEIDSVSGQRTKVAESVYRAGDIAIGIRHVNKIYRYLLEVSNDISGIPGTARFARIGDAWWAQATLEEVDRRHRGAIGSSHRTLFASQLKSTELRSALT